ncbi:MAG: type I phosphomannose isomerase catalytic subunit [Planctomycetota bacterium]
MDPLTFEPLIKSIRWGGRRLGDLLGKPIGDRDDYAESWELADHGDDQTVVAAGPHAGRTLGEIVAEHGDLLFGPGRDGGQFPLLIKFLDASDRLSVQVHPDDALAAEMRPGENGKTEAWVIVAAEPGSKLFAGLKDGVDESRLRDAVAAGTLEDCLHAFEVAAGDCVFVPAGTVHAIGEGILLAEIQQMSDLTFRLYDWGRVGRDGQPRPLHIEESIRCTDFDRGPVGPVTATPNGDALGSERLVSGEYFTIDRARLTEPRTLTPADDFRVVITLAGGADFSWEGGGVTLPAGRTLLVPASAPAVTVSPGDDGVTLLISTRP